MTDTTNAVPNPEAVAQGCTCPRLDNVHGGGYMEILGMFWMNGGCPLHSPSHSDMRVTPENLDEWLNDNPFRDDET